MKEFEKRYLTPERFNRQNADAQAARVMRFLYKQGNTTAAN